MRPVLRLLGTRYGMALLLVFGVLGVVGVARLVAPSRPLVSGGVLPGATVTAYPTTGDDGLAGAPGDAIGASASPTGSGSASTSPASPPPGTPDPVGVATALTRAWLHHVGVTQAAWYAGLTPYLTASLAAKLKYTDPADVPALRVTGPFVVDSLDASYAQVSVAVDSGTVRLRLKSTPDGWLVDGIDWGRS